MRDGVRLIVGLGNPGSKYQGTRHNVGFEVIDALARRFELSFGASPSEAVMARARRSGAQVILAKPLTYVNRSGEAVNSLQRYYRIDLDAVLVVADDVNLPLGRLRAREGGSDGGHHGFGSIIKTLGTEEFARLRVGVGRGDERRDLADHVLARFDEAERDGIKVAIQHAADAVDVFVSDGIDAVMNRFNRLEETALDDPAPVGGGTVS